MKAIVIYEFDKEQYDKMRQSSGDPELVAAQIAYTVTTQGDRLMTIYVEEVELDDLVEHISCIL